jgi:ligand-binding sensor domain-containing protein/serine phosphatase RsbU (regulator of sigma subunit)
LKSPIQNSIILILLNFSLQLYAQVIPTTYYTQKEGLGNNMATDIYQDKNGNVWISTLGGGLSVFDGKKFKNYGLESGLISEVIRTVAEDTIKKRFIIGTMGKGIHILQNDTIIQFNENPAEIFVIHQQKNKTWIGANNGLFLLDEKDSLINFSKQQNIPENSITHISEDKDGNIWFNYDSYYGLYKFDGKIFQVFKQENGLTDNRVLGSFHDSDKNTWVGTSDGLYFIEYNSKKASKINAENLPDYYLFDFAEPQKNILLIGTQDKGLIIFDSKKRKVLKNINTKQGLKSSLVFRVFTDFENNIWISNWGDGVARIHFSGLYQYADFQENEFRTVYDIYKYQETFISTNNGIFTCQNNQYLPYKPTIFKGSFWKYYQFKNTEIAIHEKYLLLLKNNKISKKEDEFLKGIKCITPDKKGNLYLAGWGGGIVKFDGENFTSIPDSLYGGIKYFYCGYTDSKGRIWFGSWDGGLFKLENEKWTQFGMNGELPATKITCITEDKNGNIIVGTLGGGIAILNNKNTKIITTKNGLPSNSVYSIIVDSNNTLWAGFQGTVSKISLTDYSIFNYNSEYGFNGDCIYGSIAIFNDKIAFGTNNNLWIYDENYEYPLKKNLRIFIKNIYVNHEKTDFLQNKVFSFNQNRFDFEFECPQIVNNSQLSFYYRLIGADSNFTKINSTDLITFHKLSFGKYTFQLKACINNDCSEVPISWSFQIATPFWLKWWFGVIAVLLTGIFIRYLIIFREKRFIKKQKELEEIVQNRTLEIALQKKVVEHKNREIIDSIQYAQKIQSAILPSEELFKKTMPDSFVLFKPKDIVSGDFYWLSDREDYIFYATADSTGHGVPGGFMSMLGTALLNEIIDERKIEDCGQVLTLMREKIMHALKQAGDSESKDGMDMVLIRIDKKTLEMEYAAANNSFYLVSNKQLAVGNENCKLQTANCQLLEMPCDKMPVGVYHSEVKPFNTFKHQLQKGDIIYTYTDGYADQFGGEKGKKYTYKRLREKLIAISEKPLAEQKLSLESEFERWKGDNEQIDDVCLIGVKA